VCKAVTKEIIKKFAIEEKRKIKKNGSFVYIK
jgi:hypothetical protein